MSLEQHVHDDRRHDKGAVLSMCICDVNFELLSVTVYLGAMFVPETVN